MRILASEARRISDNSQHPKFDDYTDIFNQFRFYLVNEYLMCMVSCSGYCFAIYITQE